MRKILISALLVAAAACATPERIARTLSGRPEVTIRARPEAVMSALVVRAAERGLAIEEQGANTLTLSREMRGMGAVWMQMAIGNSYSTTPRAEIRYIVTPVVGGTRVIAQLSASTQMAFGQVRRKDMSGNNAWFNDVQRALEEVKAQVEGVPSR